MQGQPGGPLMGVPMAQTVCVAERNAAMLAQGMPRCFKQCITHFGEDSLPYHPGEKTCHDRCIAKIAEGVDMARAVRLETQQKVMSPNKTELFGPWLAQLDADHRMRSYN
jgi:hypothetical protein